MSDRTVPAECACFLQHKHHDKVVACAQGKIANLEAEVERLRAELDERVDKHSDRAVAFYLERAEIERLRTELRGKAIKIETLRAALEDN